MVYNSEGRSDQQPVADWVLENRTFRDLAGLPDLSRAEGQSGVGSGQRRKRKRGADKGPESQSTKRSRTEQSPQLQSSLDSSRHKGYEMRGTQPNPFQDTRAREERKRPRDDVGTGPGHDITRARTDQAAMNSARGTKSKTALDRLIREEAQSMHVEMAEEMEGLPGEYGRHNPMATRSRQERSGRRIVGNQGSLRAATPSLRESTPVPTWKCGVRKRQVDSAITPWQRQALKEPRKTRSKKTGTFFALNQKGKLEAAVSRMLKQTTAQTRSQNQVEHLELNGKGQPAVAPMQRMRGANMQDQPQRNVAHSGRTRRSVHHRKASSNPTAGDDRDAVDTSVGVHIKASSRHYFSP